MQGRLNMWKAIYHVELSPSFIAVVYLEQRGEQRNVHVCNLTPLLWGMIKVSFYLVVSQHMFTTAGNVSVLQKERMKKYILHTEKWPSFPRFFFCVFFSWHSWFNCALRMSAWFPSYQQLQSESSENTPGLLIEWAKPKNEQDSTLTHDIKM